MVDYSSGGGVKSPRFRRKTAAGKDQGDEDVQEATVSPDEDEVLDAVLE